MAARPAPRTSLDEARRVAVLHGLDLSDTSRDPAFKALVELAATLLDCPASLFNLIDRDRQWSKAATGIDPHNCPRNEAFCDRTIQSPDLLIVEDAAADPRFAALPSVQAGTIRFYAGMPIHSIDRSGRRHAIGAICVIDDTPRTVSTEQTASLRRLGQVTEALIQSHTHSQRATATARLADRNAARLRRTEQRFRQAERMAQIGAWELNLETQAIEWSDGVYAIHGLRVGDVPSFDGALAFYPPRDRAEIAAALAHTIETGEPFALELDFITAQGKPRRVMSQGELEMIDGQPATLFGVFQDVTQRHDLEQALRRSAEQDELTGIANRAAFNAALEAAMADARHLDTPLLLALIDLDGFKAINDTLGHVAGDDVLRGVGRRLEQPWLKGSFAARLGGDEFAVIVRDPQLASDPERFAARLQAELRVPIDGGGLSLAATGTVGAILYDGEATVRDFVHVTDKALYAAKRLRVGERRRADRRAAA